MREELVIRQRQRQLHRVHVLPLELPAVLPTLFAPGWRIVPHRLAARNDRGHRCFTCEEATTTTPRLVLSLRTVKPGGNKGRTPYRAWSWGRDGSLNFRPPAARGAAGGPQRPWSFLRGSVKQCRMKGCNASNLLPAGRTILWGRLIHGARRRVSCSAPETPTTGCKLLRKQNWDHRFRSRPGPRSL